jgi:AraC-like DNA-binding protein
MNSSPQLIEALKESKIYRDYSHAWQTLSGMPLQLIAAGTWNFSHPGDRNAPFCGLLAGCSTTCAACLQLKARLIRDAVLKPCTRTCPFGFWETAVPVRLGQETIGYMLTGHSRPTRPTTEECDKVCERLEGEIAPDRVREAYMHARVVPAAQQRAAIRMLSIFADQLASLANEIIIKTAHAEPHLLQRTKAYIEAHLDEETSLGDLARHVGTSKFYICKLFKRSMGITYTEYRARCRVERAKKLLLEPNRRISEVAYDAGFQSLTHFNRIFRRFVGNSPSDYREHLAPQLAA